MSSLIYVALGGAIGASFRHIVGTAVSRLSGSAFPYGTLTANILGGFFMGCLAAWLLVKVPTSDTLRLFLGVGLLGGFTTFSAFSLEAFMLLQKKAYVAFGAYIGGSVILSIFALIVGMILMRKLIAL